MNLFIRIISLCAALILSQGIYALDTVAPTKKTAQVADEKIGKFEILVQTNGALDEEPVDLDLSVTCQDQRPHPNQAKPQTEKILTKEKICALNAYNYDPAKKTLTLKFSTSKEVNGTRSCDDQWTQEFDLKLLCKTWQGSEV